MADLRLDFLQSYVFTPIIGKSVCILLQSIDMLLADRSNFADISSGMNDVTLFLNFFEFLKILLVLDVLLIFLLKFSL